MNDNQSRKASLNPKYREICEALEWAVTECDDGTIELEKYSPAGEDFIFYVEAENFAKEVEEYANNFDPDDHIAMWLEVKRRGTCSGIPSPRELVHDAEEIDKMLRELAEALTEDDRKSIKEQIEE